MSSMEQNVATVALVVSLVAMLITSSQLIAQIVATAEGARKCSSSVLGPWNSSTKPNTQTIWKKNWREVRLETRFVVPDISLSTSARWINHAMYDPEVQKQNRDQWRADGEWREDATFPSSKLFIRSGSTDGNFMGRSSLFQIFKWLYWALTLSRRPLPSDCLLGGSPDLDSLLFHKNYDDRGPDRVGWINFLAFLRVEMDDSARTLVVQQRWWDRYPADPAFKPDSDGEKTLVKTPIALNTISWPKIRFVQHTWDLVPPDVVKPLASSTVGDIAIIIRRTGMVWKTFDPHSGIMGAEGGPHVISSMYHRGLGIVLQYRCLDGSLTKRVRERRQRSTVQKGSNSNGTGKRQYSDQGIFLERILRPAAKSQAVDDEAYFVHDQEKGTGWKATRSSESHGIRSLDDEEFEGDPYNPHGPWPKPCDFRYVSFDKILFGLIPSDPALGIQDFRHRSKKECHNELKQLFPNDETIHHHLDSGAPWCGKYEFNDLLRMVPEVLRQRGKPRPKYPTKGYWANVMVWTQSQFAEMVKKYFEGESFLEVLKMGGDGRSQTHTEGNLRGTTLPGRTNPPTKEMMFVQDTMQALTQGEAQQKDPLGFLEDLHTRHEHTTRYFVSISDRIPFLCLLRMHFNSAIWASWHARKDAQNKIRGMFPASTGHPWRNRNIELYFCYLPRYVDFMAQGKGGTKCTDEELVIEAWLMLMTRAFLFQELHIYENESFKEDYLPTEFYGSRLPVWLA